ncbi:MAG: hypothetical protein CMJ31_05255, partial [Phycisphaerae bacterium]|nr:hypothetical protein [Phycisphaerae bacterium]
MSIRNARESAVAAARDWSQTNYTAERIAKVNEARVDRIFGSECFDLRVMRERLPKSVFKSIQRTIEAGGP